MTQHRGLYLLKQAILMVITHFKDEKRRAGKGTDFPKSTA